MALAARAASPTASCSDRCLRSSCNSAAALRSFTRNRRAVWRRGTRSRTHTSTCSGGGQAQRRHCTHTHTRGSQSHASHLATSLLHRRSRCGALQLAHHTGCALLFPPLGIAHPLEAQLFQRQASQPATLTVTSALTLTTAAAALGGQQQLSKRRPLVVSEYCAHSRPTPLRRTIAQQLAIVSTSSGRA